MFTQYPRQFDSSCPLNDSFGAEGNVEIPTPLAQVAVQVLRHPREDGAAENQRLAVS